MPLYTLWGGLISGITITWETRNHLSHTSYFELKTSFIRALKLHLTSSPDGSWLYYAWSWQENCSVTITACLFCWQVLQAALVMIGCGIYINFWEERLNLIGKRIWGTNDLAMGRNQLARKVPGLNRYLALQGNTQLYIKIKKSMRSVRVDI